jgi:hypothetical protein
VLFTIREEDGSLKIKSKSSMRIEIECHNYLIICKNNEFALPKRYHKFDDKNPSTFINLFV